MKEVIDPEETNLYRDLMQKIYERAGEGMDHFMNKIRENVMNCKNSMIVAM